MTNLHLKTGGGKTPPPPNFLSLPVRSVRVSRRELLIGAASAAAGLTLSAILEMPIDAKEIAKV